MILISTVIIIISFFVLSLPLPYHTNLFNFIEACSIISAIYFPSFLSFGYSFRTGFFVVAVFFRFCPEFCAGSIIQGVLAIRTLRQFNYDLAFLPSESILAHCIPSFRSTFRFLTILYKRIFVNLNWLVLILFLFHCPPSLRCRRQFVQAVPLQPVSQGSRGNAIAFCYENLF